MGGKNKKHKGGGAGAGAVHAAVSAATAAARAKAAAESGAAGEAAGKRPAVRPALVSKEPRVKQGSAGERPSLPPTCLPASRGRPAPLACPLRALFPAPQAAALKGGSGAGPQLQRPGTGLAPAALPVPALSLTLTNSSLFGTL